MLKFCISCTLLTRPYFFPKGKRLNGQSCHDQLFPFHKEEGERLFEHKNWGFQQDGAGSHTADKAQNPSFRNENSHRIHPNLIHWIISSGRTPQVVWNIFKSKQSMIYVDKAMKKVDINYVQKVIGTFVRRVYTVKSVQSEHRRDRRKSFSTTGCSQRRGSFIAKNYFRDLSKPFRLAEVFVNEGCSDREVLLYSVKKHSGELIIDEYS